MMKQAISRHIIFVLASTFLLIGCDRDAFQVLVDDSTSSTSSAASNAGGNQGQLNSATLSFTQPTLEEALKLIDILFVVDTSGSLDQERAAIADGIDQFINELPQGGNIQLAMTLAHVGSRSGELFVAGGEPAVLSTAAMSIADIQADFRFKMDNTVGEGASDGGEAGMYSLYNGITSGLSDNQAAGFFRDDAALVVVFVSDENAICSRYLDGIAFVEDPNEKEIPAYNNYCLDADRNPFITHDLLIDELVALQDGLPLVSAAVVYSGENGPAPDFGENELGYGYLEFLEAKEGGFAIDLQDPAPDADLTAPDPQRIEDEMLAFGQFTKNELVDLQEEFFLEHENVVEASISVQIDGDDAAFIYDPDENKVLLPMPGVPESVVTISYDYVL